MNIWETLGIEPTTDVKLIRRRYAELVRLYHPEDQPEIYQEIVEAYQEALTYARSRKARPENSLRKASDSQKATELEEEANGKPNSSLNFENLTEEMRIENEEFETSSLDFSDYQQSTDKTSDSFNFETFKAEEDEPKSTLDFSSYNEAAYLIRNAIESIVGNDDYNQEEQEHLWRQFFSQYQYDMDIVQSVLEEMDVYIFNKSEQFSIVIPLLEDYVPDFRYWGYYYKLKYWQVKRDIVEEEGSSLESAQEATEQFSYSYQLCQEILQDFNKANQLSSWIEFFKHPFLAFMVLDQVNQNRQIIKSVPVLTYILEKNRQVIFEEDYSLLDNLAYYLEQLKEEFGENVDFSHYSLDDPDEVEAAFYELLHARYQDE